MYGPCGKRFSDPNKRPHGQELAQEVKEDVPCERIYKWINGIAVADNPQQL